MNAQKPTDKQLMDEAKASLARIKEIQKDPKWQQFSDNPCIMLKMQEGDRVMSRGQIKVNQNIKVLFDKLSHVDSLKAINPQLKQIQVLYKFTVDGKQAKVIYQRYAGIWPVEDRDLVNIGLTEYGADVSYISTKQCNYPHPKVDKVTRAICHIGGYVLKKIDDQNTYVIYISDVDLAGSIPGMIKNQLSQKQASLPARIQKTLKDFKL